MILKWLGHSAFKLTESTGTTIITDPFDPYIGYDMGAHNCDAVTISHHHKDHDYMDALTGDYEILDTIGAFEIKGVHIYSIPSSHDHHNGKNRGSNLIFKIRMDGVDICHLGDIGEECSPYIAEAIGSCNVLLIPVGGKYTITPKEAYDYVERLMPDIVIAMHYKTRNCDMDIGKIDDFIDYFDDENIVYIDDNSIELNRTTFDDERTKLYVLSID